jgi:hypothetical protein
MLIRIAIILEVACGFYAQFHIRGGIKMPKQKAVSAERSR